MGLVAGVMSYSGSIRVSVSRYNEQSCLGWVHPHAGAAAGTGARKQRSQSVASGRPRETQASPGRWLWLSDSTVSVTHSVYLDLDMMSQKCSEEMVSMHVL